MDSLDSCMDAVPVAVATIKGMGFVLGGGGLLDADLRRVVSMDELRGASKYRVAPQMD